MIANFLANLRPLRLRCWGFAATCWSVAVLHGQDCHVALRGHVTELATGEALAYANVFVKEAQRGAVTDEQGYFAIANLCSGEQYTVEVSHVECAHLTQSVRLTENVSTDFHLSHSTVLGEVVVVEKAVALAATQATQTVQGLDLESRRGQNLAETLRQLPGVSSLNTGATVAKPVIQGLHGTRIALVNNGVALESQQWGSDHAPEIDPFTAEKITVVKGAAGVRYGVGAMGGAVVLDPAPLRDSSGVGGWLSLGGFSNGRGGVAAGSADWRPKRASNWAFRLQGTAKRSGNLRAPDYFLGNTGLAELNFSGLTEWKRKGWRQTLAVSHFSQKIGVLRAAHTGNLSDLQLAIESDTPRNNLNYFTYHLDRPQQRVDHNVLKYRSEWHLSDVWKLSGQYSFQYNNRREYDRVRQSSSAADKAQVSFRLWSNTLDVALEHLPIRHWQGGVGVQAQQQINYVSRGGFIPDYLGFGGAVWATERWRRYPSPWEFELGARYDYRWQHATTTGNASRNLDQMVQFGNVSGTAGAIYHLNRATTVLLNSGLAWRPPTVNELFARGVHHGAGTFEQGDSTLTTEKAWNTNLTLRYQSPRPRGLVAEVSVFRNQIRDFIYLDPQNTLVLTVRGAFPAYFYKQADVVLQGLDASASWPLWQDVSLETRASLLRGFRQTNDPENPHDWLPLLPADRFQYGLQWSSPTRRLAPPSTTVKVLAVSALRQTRIPDAGLLKAAPPAFTTLNLDASHRLALPGQCSLELGLTVQNLTNARYREYLNFFRYYADEVGVNVGLRGKLTF